MWATYTQSGTASCGGEKFKESLKIDNLSLNNQRAIPIAPLHNPPNLTGIEEAMRLFRKPAGCGF